MQNDEKSTILEGNMFNNKKDILPSVLNKQIVTQCDTLEQLVYHIITLNNIFNEMAKFIINVSKIKGRLEVKISQNIWSNLKKVEIYLISKIMKYKIDPIDLKHLLGKGFTKQNRPNIILNKLINK